MRCSKHGLILDGDVFRLAFAVRSVSLNLNSRKVEQTDGTLFGLIQTTLFWSRVSPLGCGEPPRPSGCFSARRYRSINVLISFRKLRPRSINWNRLWPRRDLRPTGILTLLMRTLMLWYRRAEKHPGGRGGSPHPRGLTLDQNKVVRMSPNSVPSVYSTFRLWRLRLTLLTAKASSNTSPSRTSPCFEHLVNWLFPVSTSGRSSTWAFL